MVTSTKTTAKNPAAPTKAPAKKVSKAAVPAKPAKAAAAKPVKTAVAGKPAKAAGRKAPVKPEQRRNYIEVAAYFIAERHGFTPGRELTDWAAAEEVIDRLLAAGLLNP